MKVRENTNLKHEKRLREWEEKLREEAAELQSKFACSTTFDEIIPNSPARLENDVDN